MGQYKYVGTHADHIGAVPVAPGDVITLDDQVALKYEKLVRIGDKVEAVHIPDVSAVEPKEGEINEAGS